MGGGPSRAEIGAINARYPVARDAGVQPIREFLDTHIPWLSDRTHLLTDFARTTLLSCASSSGPRGPGRPAVRTPRPPCSS
jgi:hypothetical protein